MKTFLFLTISLLLVLCVVFFLYSGIVSIKVPQTVSAQKNQSALLSFSAKDFPEVSAQAYLVFDVATGQHFAVRNQELVLPIASVTKLYTAVLAQDTLEQVATTSIDWNTLGVEGDAGKLHYGENYSAEALLFPLLLESSNDAAQALVHLSHDTLVARMNTWSKEQGMDHTTFSDASGLSVQNVSTAADLKIMLTLLYKKYPHILDITKLHQYIGVYTGWRNNNPLHNHKGYLGGKHGFTPEALRTQIALFSQNVGGETRVIGYIVLGSQDSARDISVLHSHVTDAASGR